MSRPHLLVGLALLLLVVAPVHAERQADDELSIAVRRQATEVSLSATHGFVLRDLVRQRQVLRRTNDSPIHLEACSEGIQVDGLGTFSEVSMQPLPGSVLTVDGQRYRGRFRVTEDKFNRITVVNLVGVEDYLKGVIPAEMLVSSPMEALKAQAVVARTFALRHRDRFTRARGYDLTACVNSQVYRGQEGENPRTTQAVLETLGTVLHVDRQLVESFYHQACGGRTQNNEDVWGGRPLPHLRSVDCCYCAAQAEHAGYRYFDWSYSLTRTELQAKLLVQGYQIGDILEVHQNLEQCGSSRTFTLSHSRGELVLAGARLRHLVGTDKLLSSFFRLAGSTSPAPVEQTRVIADPLAEANIRGIIGSYMSLVSPPQEIRFEGRGAGHGVGLCQWGTRYLASIGKSYTEILHFYFQDVSVGPLPSPRHTGD